MGRWEKGQYGRRDERQLTSKLFSETSWNHIYLNLYAIHIYTYIHEHTYIGMSVYLYVYVIF